MLKWVRAADAAAVALAALTGKIAAPHAQLARLRQREFGAKWRFNRSLRRIVGRGTSVEVAGIASAMAPWILRRIVRFAGDVPSQ